MTELAKPAQEEQLALPFPPNHDKAHYLQPIQRAGLYLLDLYNYCVNNPAADIDTAISKSRAFMLSLMVAKKEWERAANAGHQSPLADDSTNDTPCKTADAVFQPESRKIPIE